MADGSNDNAEPVTYDMRPDDDGWTVYNTVTLEPARVNGVPQTGLEMEKADDLVDLLNLLERQKSQKASH